MLSACVTLFSLFFPVCTRSELEAHPSGLPAGKSHDSVSYQCSIFSQKKAIRSVLQPHASPHAGGGVAGILLLGWLLPRFAHGQEDEGPAGKSVRYASTEGKLPVFIVVTCSCGGTNNVKEKPDIRHDCISWGYKETNTH